MRLELLAQAQATFGGSEATSSSAAPVALRCRAAARARAPCSWRHHRGPITPCSARARKNVSGIAHHTINLNFACEYCDGLDDDDSTTHRPLPRPDYPNHHPKCRLPRLRPRSSARARGPSLTTPRRPPSTTRLRMSSSPARYAHSNDSTAGKRGNRRIYWLELRRRAPALRT